MTYVHWTPWGAEMAVASGRSDRAEQDRRTEWLALAARAARADQAARAQRQTRRPAGAAGGSTARTDRVIARSLALADSAIGARPAARAGNRPDARAAARSAARTVERTAELARPRSAAGFVVLLVVGSLYGLLMAAVTAVAVARFAMTEPLGAVGPVAFVGVAVGFIALCALILPSARSRRD